MDNKIRIKTCFGCKALESNCGNGDLSCSLGYPTKTKYVPKHGRVLNISPLDLCPKPLSTKKFAALLLNKQHGI